MGKRAKDSGNKNMIMIVAVIAVVIVIALLIVFLAPKAGNNDNQNVTSAEQQQSDNNNKLAQVQSKIDAQEKVINDLNAKLAPLVEERTKLEDELMQLTSSGEATPVEPAVDENGNPVETTEPTEETEVTPAEEEQ